MTTDVPAAKKFYGILFGWTFNDMPMEAMTYSVLKANEDEVGGVMPNSYLLFGFFISSSPNLSLTFIQ